MNESGREPIIGIDSAYDETTIKTVDVNVPLKKSHFSEWITRRKLKIS